MDTAVVLDPAVRAAFGGARILVTGGGGFIARHLTDALMAAAARVTLVGDRAHPQLSADDADRPTVQPLPVGSDAFRRFLTQEAPFDFIFHLAGRTTATGSVDSPTVDFASNLTATLDLLECLRRRAAATRLVYTSSAAVYGHPLRLPIAENDPVQPVSPYGLSKLAAEQYVRLYASLYGISAVSLRPFSVYGPLQTKQVVYCFLRELHERPGELTVLGDGQQLRDMVYVGDVVRALMTAAVRGVTDGGAYNVATGVGISIGELARLVIRLVDASALVSFTGSERSGDQHDLLGSNDAIASIGGSPVWPLVDGLRATIDWFNSTSLSMSGRARNDLVEECPVTAAATVR